MSMILSLAGGRSNRAKNWSDKAQNLTALWGDLGFTKISLNKDYTHETTSDSCAYGCASKNITVNGKKYTLISMCINGCRLFKEWEGAVNLGTSGDAAIIREKAEDAESYLKKYIRDYSISGDVKLWITGYGAGACKVDLLAADLDDGLSLGNSVTLSLDDLYVYCFNCAKIALSRNGLNSSVYKNIKIYNDPCFFMNYFVPSAYGMGKYGEVHNFPSKNGTSDYSRKVKVMKQMLSTIDGSPVEYKNDEFQMKKSSLSEPYILDNPSDNRDLAEFLSTGVDELCEACAPTRSSWETDFREDCGVLLSYMFGGLDDNWTQAIDYFMEYVKKKILSVALNIILKNNDKLASIYTDGLRESMKKAGVTDYDDAMLKKFSKVLADTLIALGINHMEFEATFLGNMKIILFDANDPTISLAWLMSEDPYYLDPDSFYDSVDLSECIVKLSKTSYTYNGSTKKPIVTVIYNGEELTKGEDFTVAYKNNKNAGKATVTVTGKGSFTGTVKKTFTIKKANGEVTAKNMTKVYSTSSRSIAIDLETNSTGDITYSSSNSSIKVTSDGNVKIPAKFMGKSIITITAAATKNYTEAETTMVVKVNPTKTQISSLSNPSSGKVVIKWSKNSSATGYQVQVSDQKDFSTVNARYPKPTSSKKDPYTTNTDCYFNKIPKGITIYARMRTVKVVNKVKYYSGWSTVKSIKVSK